jgi:hypothetical protein
MSESTPYILPSGRIVAVRTDLARGRDYILYQLGNGSIVTASRTIALASDLATARSVIAKAVS